jgi:hypothetical protein
MTRLTNRALSGALALILTCGFTLTASADPGNAHGHAAHTNSAMHGNSSRHGSSASAHSCLNPAGNMRGWCQKHTGGAFVTGRVTRRNGDMATILLPNRQSINADTQYLLNHRQNLSVGQQVTLRGLWQNNTFDVNNPAYNNYNGPYSAASVKGMIVSVSGSSVRIAQGFNLITISSANAAVTGLLYPGRTITASGGWSGNTFLANSIQ